MRMLSGWKLISTWSIRKAVRKVAGHLRRKGYGTHVAMPTTTYVAYQKLTSPPSRPVAGGYHGMMTRNRFAARLNITDTSHARNSALDSPSWRRRCRMMYRPAAMKRAKIAAGYVCKSTTG